VRAEVVAATPGRLFGQPGAGAIRSRLVTLRVDEVLAGTPPPTATIVVEEEGWLEDGTPVVVDGAPGSRPGDDAVWFLVEVASPDVPVHVSVGAQGRYLISEGGLRGADGDDPLVRELAALTVAELADRLTALPG